MISENTTLVVVDLQEKLIPVMHRADQLIANIQKLIQCASLLSVPMLRTEQRPERLGPTIAPIRDFFSKAPIIKTMMSAVRCQEFKNKLKAFGRKNVLLCGIEAHVCVYQTACELVALGYVPYYLSDCITSRTPENKAAGIEAMRENGVKSTSLEMAIFDLVKDSLHPKFKEILGVIK